MKQTKQFQLAKLYRGGMFFGFAVAVDGEIIGRQVSSNIETLPGSMPVINAQFMLTESEVETPIVVHLDQDEPPS